MKKRLSLLMAILSIFIFAGCGASSADNKDVQIIRVAFNQNTEHPQYLAMKKLGEDFERETNGRYKMKIYSNGVLGSQTEVLEFIRTGALQMAIVPTSSPEGYSKDFAIVGAPYLYDNIDHMSRAVQAGVYDKLFKSANKFGFEPITIYTAGERNVYSKKPINNIEDLKGMIIRVNDSPTYIKMTELMGGSGAVMAQSEVYTALQQGVIDAGENSELVFRDFKHYEVSPYYSYTKHIVHPDVAVASTEFLESLSEEDRDLLYKLVKDSAQYEFDTFKEKVAEAKKEIEEKGTQFCYPDSEKLREMVSPLTESIANQSELTREVYDAINELREEKND